MSQLSSMEVKSFLSKEEAFKCPNCYCEPNMTFERNTTHYIKDTKDIVVTKLKTELLCPNGHSWFISKNDTSYVVEI